MRLFGHPLHPALVHFPIAGWVLAALCDAAWLANGDAFFSRAALWLQGVGLIAAGAAVIAGVADLGSLQKKPKAVSAATAHITVMIAAASAAGAGFFGKLKTPPADSVLSWPVAAGFAAAGLVVIGAFFGAELVYRHGFGRREE